MRTESRKRGPKRISNEQQVVSHEQTEVHSLLIAQSSLLGSIFSSQVRSEDGYMATSCAGSQWTTEGRRPTTLCASAMTFSLRKEVIQPQVLLRLPCYDFTPIMSCTLDGCLLAVSTPASSTAHFRDVTGGVYKARERIHRGVLIRDY